MIQIFGGKQVSSLTFLERVLQCHYRLDKLPALSYTAFGKPFFSDIPELHFSISHSGTRILCAIDSRPVGVDIELLTPRQPQLPRYSLTSEEYTKYLSLGGTWDAFYTLWTKKEAWSKYTGDGIGKSFRQPPQETGLNYETYVGSDWRATVCGEGVPTKKILWLDSEAEEEPCYGKT
jgi:4'-phosphopantetheinyl transferase